MATSGLTVVTSDGLVPGRGHVDVATAAIAGGAHAVQLRAKGLDDAALLELAATLVALCGPAGRAAADAGADYLGVTVFPTRTKSDARPIGLEGLARVAAATPLPVVAIGGITADRVRAVLEAGASGVAVVSAVGAAPDPVAATCALVERIALQRGPD
ncbi:MAG: thiamine phosphate synthase [Actinobacteria bacterium]|nr:thiamine phosphate synthase [Actinomycetota bacterium]